MKLKFFEAYTEDNIFPDNFNEMLKRKANTSSEKYIDDPSKREVKVGNYSGLEYIAFCKNFVNVGIQDPTKSIHMFLTDGEVSYMGSTTYNVIPEKNAKFSFNKYLKTGGLGSTFFFPYKVYKEILGKEYNGIQWYNNNSDCEGKKLFSKNIKKYIKLVNDYQQELFDYGVIGNLTYDELVYLCHQKTLNTLQVWTESPCLLIKIKD